MPWEIYWLMGTHIPADHPARDDWKERAYNNLKEARQRFQRDRLKKAAETIRARTDALVAKE